MLAIECITSLDSVVTYYEPDKNEIDLKKLNGDIKKIDNQMMAALLSRMLQRDPSKRVTLREINSLLGTLSDCI